MYIKFLMKLPNNSGQYHLFGTTDSNTPLAARHCGLI